MKILIATFTLLFAAFLASAQTFNPYLPDVPVYDYSGDSNYYQVWINWDHFTGTGLIGNSALCSAAGLWGNGGGSYAGYAIGGAVAYHSTLPQACGPLIVSLNATEISENPYGYVDHLTQYESVTPEGTAPGGRRGVILQYEACSLVGDDGTVGEPHTVSYDPGLCIYYGGRQPM